MLNNLKHLWVSLFNSFLSAPLIDWVWCTLLEFAGMAITWRATEGQWNPNGDGAVTLTLIWALPPLSLASSLKTSHILTEQRTFFQALVPNFLFPIYLPIKKKTVKNEDNELLLQRQHQSLLTLCRYFQLGLQLLIMRDGSKKRRIPSVHWAEGYNNLITNGHLENSIRFFLQMQCSLQAWDCPRLGQLHLFLCRWGCYYVFVVVLKTVLYCL